VKHGILYGVDVNGIYFGKFSTIFALDAIWEESLELKVGIRSLNGLILWFNPLGCDWHYLNIGLSSIPDLSMIRILIVVNWGLNRSSQSTQSTPLRTLVICLRVISIRVKD
jgi:hypothetical protein